MPKLNNSNAAFWVIFKHCEAARALTSLYFLLVVVLVSQFVKLV